MIRPWPTVSTRRIGEFRVFTLRADVKVSPRTGRQHEVYVLDTPDWVNAVALTRDRRIVMVEQYRHGSETVELELPGGIVDREDASPVAAAERELREETGFEGEQARVLAVFFPNPAIQGNRCHTVLVEHCRLRHPTTLDQGEDLATRLVPMDELPALVRGGHIRHSIMVAALYHLDLWLRARLDPRGPPAR